MGNRYSSVSKLKSDLQRIDGKWLPVGKQEGGYRDRGQERSLRRSLGKGPKLLEPYFPAEEQALGSVEISRN